MKSRIISIFLCGFIKLWYMNKRIYIIGGVSIFAILCLLIFQGVWLNRVIEFKKTDYLNLINNTLSGAVESGFEDYVVDNTARLRYPVSVSVNSDESLVKFSLNGDTTIMSYNKDTGYSGIFRKVCYDLINDKSEDNIIMLDSVCKLNFRKKGIKDEYILELINTENGEILASTEETSSRTKRRIVSSVVELGLKSHHGVIVYFDMPYKAFFRDMAGALISSFLLLAFLFFCLYYQIRTIIAQYRESKIREEFMSSLVHELKLPLATVQNAVTSVKSNGVENLKEEQLKYLDIMYERTDILNKTVHKLLSVWKQGFKISWNKLNLRITIDSLVALFDPVLIGKNVTIKVNYQLSVDVIEADDMHFPNAISNLIENAIKYSGDPAEVEIECKEVEGMVAIAVKDNGIGIPKKFQEKIFDRYFRVQHVRSTDVHSFGLGLSYVKQVIEAHEGVIRLKSEVGEGTTFTVMIPLIKDENN